MKNDALGEVDFKSLYANLVVEVDEAVGLLDHIFEQKIVDWLQILQIKDRLQNALLEAEEQYIQAVEKTEHL